MSADCTFLNPLVRDGTSQRQRALAAQDPSFVQIDERGLDGLLRYALRYAELLQYTSPSNSRAGDWVPFLRDDVSTVVAAMAAYDARASREAFESALRRLEDATGANVLVRFEELLSPLADRAVLLDEWRSAVRPGLTVHATLERLIRSALNEAVRDALVCSETAASTLATVPAGLRVLEQRTRELKAPWELSGIHVDAALLTLTGKLDRHAVSARMRAVYERFHEALVSTREGAEAFLSESVDAYAGHAPHMALLLAFLKLFGRAQEHLNSLGGAHLDFYYRDVLGLERRPAKPDSAHIVVTPAKSVEAHAIDAGTRIKGKSPDGVELTFETDDELVVNKAVVGEEHGLKTVFVDRDVDTGEVLNVYAATRANTADGIEEAIEDAEGRWATFGSRRMPYAEIGFAVASPMLALAEGTRTITIGFDIGRNSPPPVSTETEIRRNTRIFATGPDGWFEIASPVAAPPASEVENVNHLNLRVELEPGDPAIVAYDPKLHAGGFETKHPMLRFAFDNDAFAWPSDFSQPGQPSPPGEPQITTYSPDVPSYSKCSVVRHEGRLWSNPLEIDAAGVEPVEGSPWTALEHRYPYEHVRHFEVQDVAIKVKVTGMSGLILENDLGALDPAKPFLPFGPRPKVGSRFLIGSPEVFGKPVGRVELHLTWADLPTVNFKEHYEDFPSSPVNGNAHFKIEVEVLDDGVWREPKGGRLEEKLFANGEDSTHPSSSLKAPKDERDLPVDLSPATLAARLLTFRGFDVSLRRGFMRLSLNQSFLHAEYPTYLAQALSPGGGSVPNPPYTPLLAALELDYDATHVAEYGKATQADFEDRVGQLFQIGPFGHREIYPIPDDPTASGVPIDRCLVPRWEVPSTDPSGSPTTEVAEGTLLVGLRGLDPPENVSLLFRMAEGSEEPTVDVPEVTWSYLADGVWQPFGRREIVSDGTRGLVRTGIVTFQVPRRATVSRTVLQEGLHWIRASVRSGSVGIPQAVAVRAQAVAASFESPAGDPSHLASPLPAKTLSKLVRRDSSVKKVEQPYASFGGRLPEAAPAFRIRVAERLRHKGRAITPYDYERLVLEAFPEVYKVKCVNHTTGTREHAAGHVRVVVVPDLRNQNAVDPLRPRLSRSKRTAIYDHLVKLSGDFVSLEVDNPTYEEVEARFSVRFQAGLDKGLYTTRLQADLIRHLSPWLYDAGVDLTFGGRIHRSEILYFVEELPYVDFVTHFRMDHRVPGRPPREDVEEAVTTSSSAALVSAPEHVIDTDTESCLDD